MRLLSKEYLMKNATPMNRANPPTHAKPFTPMNCSQLIFGFDGAEGVNTGGGSAGADV